MKKPSKSKSKKTMPKAYKRLGLKVIWFCLVAFLIFIFGAVLALTLFSLDRPETSGDFVAWVIVSSALLIIFLFALSLLLKRSKKTLWRWTRKSSLLLIPLVALACWIVVVEIKENNYNAQQPSAVLDGVQGQIDYVEGLTFTNDKLLSKTNEERALKSVKPLTINEKLNQSAQAKCNDMVKNNYWSHNDNNGQEPWRFIENAGYSQAKAGENLAYGFNSEEATVKGWMNSEGHKKNLLDSGYIDVGFGLCRSENYVNKGKQLIVVQHFGTPAPARASGPSARPVEMPKPYVAPVCTKTPIPYNTIYKEASYLYVDETQEYGGTDGYRHTCTADSTGYRPSDIILPPYDKTIYRGTKPRPAPPSSTTTSTGYTYAQALSIARNNCARFGDSSAYEVCIDAVLDKYGY